VKKIPRQGGTVISICEADTPALASWTAPSSIYFTETETYTLSRVSADGGKPEKVLTNADVTMTRFNDVLPDGRNVLAEKSDGISGEFGGIYLVDMQTRKTNLLIRPGYAGRFAAPNYLLFARAGNLMAARLDLGRGEVIGEPVTLASGVAMESLFGMLHASASSGLKARPLGKKRTTPALSRRDSRLQLFDPVQGHLDLVFRAAADLRLPGGHKAHEFGRTSVEEQLLPVR
jgi:hypothetical protein